MAFLKRVSKVLNQSVRKHASSKFLAPSVPLFQAVRSMSYSSKIFVQGIRFSMDDVSLKEAFSKHGEVVEAKVVFNPKTGRSRGYGFVTFTSSDAASSAIQAFDGQDLLGRKVRVQYANDSHHKVPRVGDLRGGYGVGGGCSYGGQGGNYSGYQGGGSNINEGGYGSGSNYPSGGANSVQGDTNCSSEESGLSSSSVETSGDMGLSQGAVSGQQDSMEAVDEDIRGDSLDKRE